MSTSSRLCGPGGGREGLRAGLWGLGAGLQHPPYPGPGVWVKSVQAWAEPPASTSSTSDGFNNRFVIEAKRVHLCRYEETKGREFTTNKPGFSLDSVKRLQFNPEKPKAAFVSVH